MYRYPWHSLYSMTRMMVSRMAARKVPISEVTPSLDDKVCAANPPSGVGRLYVIGVDAPLFPKRGLPTHRPRKQRWIAQMIVSGGDKKLRNLPFIQVSANGKVARSSERAKHQQDVVFLDKTARKV